MRKPCKHGVILPRGLRCYRGYLFIYIMGPRFYRGFGLHTPVNEKAASDVLKETRYRRAVNLPIQRTKKEKACPLTRYQRLKEQMFCALGRECRCCGETEVKFLTLDHVASDGAAERRRNRGSGTDTMEKANRLGFPKASYQVLCWNCNCGRSRNQGICPHKLVNQLDKIELAS